MVNKVCCAQCCSIFSGFAFFFLIWLGSTIVSGSWTIEIPEKHRSSGAQGCFISAVVYLVFLGISVFVLVKERVIKVEQISAVIPGKRTDRRMYMELGRDGGMEREPIRRDSVDSNGPAMPSTVRRSPSSFRN
eukprot:GILI01003111.1.p1 GENE.GILI01003111.1~~GILI01003111.1.p1  ORF type:complete len:133 (-),score=20.06 GILI01003111.1:375-773(-)